ncbi:MAG: L,D-transpeptidase [Candidatus Sericytochromatia bacterium]
MKHKIRINGAVSVALLMLSLPAQALSLEQDFQLSPIGPSKPSSVELQWSQSEDTQPGLALPFVSLSDKQVLTDLKGTWISLLTSTQAHVSLRLELNGRSVYQNSLNTAKGLSLPSIPLKPGKNDLTLTLDGTDTQSHIQKFTLYNLGPPPGPTFALVDKYNFTLYYVQDQILTKIYPIATGRPRTPTPLGLFIMARKEVMPYANTGWGVRRMLIYTPAEYARGHWAGYAVHGTNNPASIGTEASHGCVRMFNQDVTELSQMMPLQTPVLIREQLPFYIEKL